MTVTLPSPPTRHDRGWTSVYSRVKKSNSMTESSTWNRPPFKYVKTPVPPVSGDSDPGVVPLSPLTRKPPLGEPRDPPRSGGT